MIHMQKIIEKEFWDIYYNSNLNILELYWKNIGKNLKLEEFKSYLLELVELIKKYKPKGFLVDSRKYHMVLSIDFQTWHDNTIIPSYLKYGIQNIIFVINQDETISNQNEMIANLSLELTFEEVFASAIETSFTHSLEQARDIFNV